MALRSVLLGSIAAMAAPAVALAQAAPASVSEVVVTAEKRAENLIKVPVSVTAVSGAKLEQTEATRLQDWAGYVPGFQLGEYGAPGQTFLAIDGVTPVGSASEVGVYIGDTALGSSSSFQGSNTLSPDLMPYDLERVEVLRGPQGTLYGASTMGGLIKYVLADPDLTKFSGRIGGDLFGVENGGNVGAGVRAMINAPIVTDKLAFRVSVYDENTPGYIDDATTGAKADNAREQAGVRGAVLWKPIDTVSVEAEAIWQRNHSDNLAIVALSQTTGQPIAGPLDNINTRPEPFTQDLQLYDLKLNWDLKWATLTSVTSWQQFDNRTTQDLTDYIGVYLGYFGAAGPGQADLAEHYNLQKFTQEVRLASPTGGRFEWLVGGFYTRETGINDEVLDGYDETGSPLTSLNPLEQVMLPSTYEEYAFFGDLTIHVTNWFDIDGGLRWAHNSQTFIESEGGSLIDPEDPTTPALVVPGQSSESVTTFMVSPSVHLTPNSNFYARIASGYQPGGPNVVLPGVSNVPTEFFSSRLTDYQLGYKQSFLNGRASVDVSAFDIEWSKIQVSVLIGNQSAIENAGKARSQGLDFSGTLSPAAGLTLGASLAYDDAHLTAPVPSITAASGARLPLTPMWSGSFTADYAFPISDSWRGFIGGGWRYVGSRYSFIEGSTDNGAPQGREASAYGVVDLHLGARAHGLTVSLFAKNLLDNRAYLATQSYFNDALGLPIDITAPVLQPRTVGLSVDKAF
jgi:iron complex outermembrane recepter protein